MSVYVIALITITDREEYGTYEAGFMEILTEFGGQLLAVDEQGETIEGEWPYTRTVILNFPSADAMKRWYESPQYQKLAQHRFNGAQANIHMVSGLSEALLHTAAEGDTP